MDSAGDGGIAGKGGVVRVSKESLIYAYNGDMVTNNDYENIYEYDAKGNKTDTKLEAIACQINKNSLNKIIPAKIFSQDGILRAVYKTNAFWENSENKPYKEGYSYNDFKRIFGEKINESETRNINVPKDESEYKLICIRSQQECVKTTYINPQTNSCQGIGSGAGYIELDNGTYEQIP